MQTTAKSDKDPSRCQDQKPSPPKHMHIMRIIEQQRVGNKLIVIRRCLYYPLCKHTDRLEM